MNGLSTKLSNLMILSAFRALAMVKAICSRGLHPWDYPLLRCRHASRQTKGMMDSLIAPRDGYIHGYGHASPTRTLSTSRKPRRSAQTKKPYHIDLTGNHSGKQGNKDWGLEEGPRKRGEEIA